MRPNTRHSSNGNGNERDYLRAQAKLAKQDFKRAAKGSAKSARRLLNIPAWVERSPFGTMTAAFVAGYVAESCLGSRSQNAREGRETNISADHSTTDHSKAGNHRFLAILIERTLRYLIESSLIAWLLPAVGRPPQDTPDTQQNADEINSDNSEIASSSIES